MAKFPIAVMTPFTDQTDPPGTVAAAAERYGFDMLCMGEHPFYPVRMNTPYPGGGETPRWYQRIADLFVVLAMAAQATSTIRLASSVVWFRNATRFFWPTPWPRSTISAAAASV